MLTIVATIFVIGILVLVHELGHFVTAKATGMRVDEFAIGFGPKLFSVTKGETVYSLRAIPLGGFTDIAGMDPEDNDAGERGYCRRPIWARMIVILAGVFMNFILPIFIFFGIYFVSGVSEPNPEPVLGSIIAGKPAETAGLQEGDRVIAINGESVATWKEFSTRIQGSEAGVPLTLSLERGGEELSATVTPQKDAASGRNVVGVMSSVLHYDVGFFESISLAVSHTGAIIYMMADGIYRIILEMSGAGLAGPIGVAQMAGEVAEMGILPLLSFTAFLSINLAIINLFPIPALDGGHFLTLCVEAVRGKPLSSRALGYAQRAGIALLVTLMLFATANDILRVFVSG